MGIIFRESKKEYVILTPSESIRCILRSMGYKNSYLFVEKLTDENMEFLKKNKKSVVIMYYDETESGKYDDEKENLKSLGIKNISINFSIDYELEENKLSLEEFIKKYWKKERLEGLLIRRKLIHTTDYENRCGNCRSHLKTNAKYCDKCGTRVGDGTYEPFYDEINAVYGPPIKIRHKCKKCNSLWITSVLGGDPSTYCPECGTKDIKVFPWEVKTWSDFIGDLDPIDYDTESPILLSENTVDTLVNAKPRMKSAESTLKRVFKKIGLAPVDKRNQWNLTDRQAEQNNLGLKILRANGVDPNGDIDIKCPRCGGRYKGYYSYKAYLARSNNSSEEVLCNASSRDSIVQDAGGLALDYIDPSTQPAFFCLQCSENYGNLKIDGKAKKMEEIGKGYRKD